MKNYEERTKEALEFNEEGSCYIHIEATRDTGSEILLGGDGIAVMMATNALINRISELTNISYDEVIGTLQHINETAIQVEQDMEAGEFVPADNEKQYN